MSRGMITPEILEISKNIIGEEITVRQLRLLPYIDFALKNDGNISNTNIEEKEIISEWVAKEYIVASSVKITSITKEFFDFMQTILWEAYVIK